MSDIVLGIKLKADGKGLVGEVKLSSQEIGKLGNKAEDSGRKARKGSKGVEKFGHSAQSASQSVGTLARRMIGLIGTGFAVRELKRATDVYINANALLRVASNSTSEFTTAQTELAKIAKDTRQSWESVVQVYARLTLNTKDLGFSQRDLLTVTKALNQSISVSGASSTEAGAALIQLSQGLAAGALRGDELRSVMEQLPFVARQIAKGMGIPFSEFRKRSQEGKITSQAIVDAMVKQSGEIQAAFNKMPPTIDQALTQIGNEFIKLAGREGEMTGATQDIVDALMAVAGSIKDIPGHLDDVAVGLTAVAAQALIAKAGLAGMSISLATAATSAKALGKALLPLAAAEGLLKIFQLGSIAIDTYNARQQAAAAKTRNATQAMKIYGEILLPASAHLKTLGVDLANIDASNIIQVTAALRTLNNETKKRLPTIAPDVAKSKPQQNPGIDNSIFDKLITNAATATGQLENAFQTPFERISDKYVAMFQTLDATQATGTAKQIATAKAAQAKLTSAFTQYLAIKEAAEAESDQRSTDAAVQSASQKFAAMQQAAEDFGATEEERAINKLDRQLTAMDEERAALEEQNAFKAEIEQQWQETRAAIIEEGVARVNEARRSEAQQAVSLEAKKHAIIGSLQSKAVSQGIGLLEMFAGKSKAIALILIALRTAQAVQDIQITAATAVAQTEAWGAVAAARALAELGPIAGPPAAAAIEASTQALVAKIGVTAAIGSGLAIAGGVLKGVAALKGGGSNASGTFTADPATGLPIPGGSSGFQQQQQPAKPITQITIINQGNVLTPEFLDENVIPHIKDRINNSDVVMIQPGSAQHQVLAA